MPVVLDPAGASAWLNERTPEDDLLALCRPVDDARLALHPVSRRMNKPEVEGPACIEPTEQEQPERSLFG